MGIEFDIEGSKTSFSVQTSSGYCDLPLSSADDQLLLFISYLQRDGLTTSLDDPTGWTSRGSAAGMKFYSHVGGITGSVQITFSTNPSAFRAWCVKMSGMATSSPYSSSYSATGSTTSHLINAGAGAPADAAVFLGAVTFSAIPEITVDFISPDAIFVGHCETPIRESFGRWVVPPLTVSVKYAEDSGDPSSHTWQSIGSDLVFPFAASSGMGGFWITPLQAPSAPTVYAPAANAKFTSGSDVTISWTGATDPVIDTEDLTYDVYISNNNGISYGSPIVTTSAGVLSYVWDTTGYGAGNYKVQVIANNGTDDGTPGYSGTFQLFADTTPSAPINLSPSGYISQAARTFTATAVNPDFDTVSAYELRWSTNPDMSSPSTTGTVVATEISHAFSASTDILTPVGTKYWQVRTKGAVDNTFGPWSAVQTVIVAAAPATPTITSSSTATTAIWPVTFMAIAHSQFRHRWELFSERFNGIVQSSAFGFNSPFSLGNGEVWSLFVSVFDPTTGLESAEATQTLTVSYTGPDTPTIEVTPLNEVGAMQIAVTNTDPGDIDHTRIYRSLNGADFQLISPRLGPNALYLDFQVANDFGTITNEYVYKARSFIETTLGYTDSAPSDGEGVLLPRLFLHVVDKTSTTSNAGLKVALNIEGKISKKYVKNHRSVAQEGRSKFLTRAGQAKHTELTYNVYIPREDEVTFPALQAVFDANATLCCKDCDMNKVFGRILELPRTDRISDIRFSLTFIESEHQEFFNR